MEKTKKTKLPLIIGIVVVVCVAIVLLITNVLIPASNYSKAEELLASGMYEEAYEAFNELGNYKDAKEKLVEVENAAVEAQNKADYDAALALLKNKKYDEAVEAFTLLNGYSDSADQIKESYYLKATELSQTEDLVGAYKVFSKIKGYKDTDALLEKLSSSVSDSIQKGSIVILGSYEQNKVGEKSDIEWIVLDRQGDKAFLISKNILDGQNYDDSTEENVYWKDSLLHNWITTEFLTNAFSTKEQEALVENKEGDKVSLLDTKEKSKYIPTKNDELRLADVTEYAKGQGVYPYTKKEVEEMISWGAQKNQSEDVDGKGDWWLKSDNFIKVTNERNDAIYCADNCSVVKWYGSDINLNEYNFTLGVRPVVWVDINKMIESY